MNTKAIECTLRYSVYFALVFASSFIVVPSLPFGARFVFGIFMAYPCMRGAVLLYADTIGRKEGTILGPLGYDPTSVKDNPGLLIPTTDLRAQIRIIAGLDLPRKITTVSAVTGNGFVGGTGHTPDRAPAALLEFPAGTAHTQIENVRQAFEEMWFAAQVERQRQLIGQAQIDVGSSLARVIALKDVKEALSACCDRVCELGDARDAVRIQARGQEEGLIAALDLRSSVSCEQEGC